MHFGGESDAALRRAADLGQGWYGFGLDPGRLGERVGKLRELLSHRDRPPADLEVSVSPGHRSIDPDAVAAYREAGADRLIVAVPARSEAAISARCEELARTVLEPARGL
ncbi:MAG TPA: LLM class flavin-dependent oxidoreductase [Longimicrobiaceae bacterium]|nr:LLM class flavin-dependent oxidoreductase [Longimicrobiaceae bacterium]